MANTYSDYTATSGQTDFAFAFPYLKDTHIIVSIDGTETDVNDTGAGSFTIVTSPSTLVRLDSGATAGANVRVKRNSLGKGNSDTTALVDYNDGSVLTEKELDDAYLHNFYLSQEAVEGAAGGISLDSSNTSWDAKGSKIINVGDGNSGKDAANVDYVSNAVNNASLGVNPESSKWTFTGDGTTTEFTFDPTITLSADTAYEVAIDGILQEPTAAYTVDATNNKITFTSAPSSGSNIVVINRGYSTPTSTGINFDDGLVGIGGAADSNGYYELKVTGNVLIDGSGAYPHTELVIKNTADNEASSILIDSTGDGSPAYLAIRSNPDTHESSQIYLVDRSVTGSGYFSGSTDGDANAFSLRMNGSEFSIRHYDWSFSQGFEYYRTALSINKTELEINGGGEDLDFKVQSDGNANMLKVDAGLNAVSIGNTPKAGYELTVDGQVLIGTNTLTGTGATSSTFESTYGPSGTHPATCIISQNQAAKGTGLLVQSFASQSNENEKDNATVSIQGDGLPILQLYDTSGFGNRSHILQNGNSFRIDWAMTAGSIAEGDYHTILHANDNHQVAFTVQSGTSDSGAMGVGSGTAQMSAGMINFYIDGSNLKVRYSGDGTNPTEGVVATLS